ncbi:MAG TPA: DUF3099 domain-containing protein [Actinopolymorphaceae bacterium]
MRRRTGKIVQSITAAPKSHKEDLRSREIRYLWSMGVRTVCFIGALVASGPLRWVLIAAAVFLPYIAVIIANAGRDAGRGRTSSHITTVRPALAPDRVDIPASREESLPEKSRDAD